ncbi:uncharacterized protein LOC117343807 [Pecten maximus]|uniref:uncharacterized protein LOC117343807 n=1 Tax=Pecten maximus TaxID=6579 RepID=UPI00145863A2|nr:uncharacterized protein LOC117343807 [Pecten maximus]
MCCIVATKEDDENLPELHSTSNSRKFSKIDTAEDYSSDLEDPAIIEMEDQSFLDEMASFDKLMNKKKERQAMAEGIEIEMTGENTKLVSVVYPAHGGMSFERLFQSDDSLKSVYTWLCCDVDADILPPKFRLDCLNEFTCIDDNCQHRYPLTAETAYRSRIETLPETLCIVEEEYTGNDTLTLYDDVLFA